MIGLTQEKDKVLLLLGSKGNTVFLSVSSAFDLSERMKETSREACKQPPEVIKGESWGMKVESYDGMVVLRFYPPDSTTTDRVPLPADVAYKLADMIAFKAHQAEHKFRILLSGR